MAVTEGRAEMQRREGAALGRAVGPTGQSGRSPGTAVSAGRGLGADELRQAFIRFFTERGHIAVPSASLVPHDPTVLFTIAGMVPFKPFFTGDETPPWPRATSVQKCFRTVDIDVVGTTPAALHLLRDAGQLQLR